MTTTSSPAPKWWTWALAQLGVAEVPGTNASNPVVVGYRKAARMSGVQGDDSVIAWCAIFVCAALESVGIRSPRQALARSFMKWGVALPRPVPGCVVVLWRGKRTGLLGHVGLLRGVATDPKGNVTHVALLGGNQNNRVSIAWFPVSRVLGYRWPADVPVPPDKAPVLKGGPVKPVTEV